MQSKTFAILATSILILLVMNLIRNQKMTFKYSVSWLGACLIALFLSIYDRLLYQISALSGFALPSNFIFFLLLIFVILMSLLLTLYINEQNGRTEALAQAIARLEALIKKIDQERKSS